MTTFSNTNIVDCNLHPISVEIGINKNKIKWTENVAGLHIHIPPIHAKCLIEVPPLAVEDEWTIGWIQAMTAFLADNTYGQCGVSSREVPMLRNGQVNAINICSSKDEQPWLTKNGDKKRVCGPTYSSTLLEIKFSDQSIMDIPWELPHYSKDADMDSIHDGHIVSEPNLSGIYHNQSFRVWLAARNQQSSQVFPLVTIEWDLIFHFNIYPFQRLGRRAKQVSPFLLQSPHVVQNQTIPQSVISGSLYNEAVSTVWRSQSCNTIISKPSSKCQIM